MIDRKKVIKGLMICVNRIPGEYDCNKCPYEIDGNNCEINMAKDALALLKEQEAVEPTLIREGQNKYYNDYVCPRCGNDVVYEQNYCSECGVRFIWEGLVK